MSPPASSVGGGSRPNPGASSRQDSVGLGAVASGCIPVYSGYYPNTRTYAYLSPDRQSLARVCEPTANTACSYLSTRPTVSCAGVRAVPVRRHRPQPHTKPCSPAAAGARSGLSQGIRSLPRTVFSPQVWPGIRDGRRVPHWSDQRRPARDSHDTTHRPLLHPAMRRRHDARSPSAPVPSPGRPSAR